ncbi:multicopper oxidase domain-containing protein [Longimicrobium sp.]|uniref:multicopper oxidase domain-containing protein n=1 Tax=Longimicrobium sp. TaxID=2029185 RepID=UPI002BB443AF|nr:multicopper oxidase domain-containing protein [Longimicrobium sp.]HSU14537.1 multicopper oxidase domain-containing protein [Longimicrobium sp.]
MRIPVVLALAVPVLAVTGGLGAYKYMRPAAGQVRTYYIAADEVSYAPAGGAAQAGYRTAVYQEYTDASFTRVKPRPVEWKHLAFLGPLIRADVGDTIRVVFRNRVGFPANVHPDAVLHHAEMDAALSATPSSDAAGLGVDGDDAPVAPGETRVYNWPVPSQVGPGADDHGSVLWLYHSRTGQETGGDAGLIGPMLIYKRGALH